MNKPEKEFRIGSIRASVWLNERNVQGDTVKFYSVRIEKSYKDGDDWKNTSTFSVENLPKVALVANEAYRFIALKERVPESPPESSIGNGENIQ